MENAPEDVVDPELIRRAAELEISSSLNLRNRLLDENSAAFRWLFASLLTVNGGAALATYSSDIISKCGKLVSGGSFLLGIFCALFLAYFTMKSSEKAIQPIGEMAGFWINVMQSGELDESALEERRAQIVAAVRPYRTASSIVGWTSAFCFLIGVVMMGLFLK